ncbi:MAG: hypothetical protein PVH68_02105 [Armatimonadota bacterium]|jgi:hypothetical protein
MTTRNRQLDLLAYGAIVLVLGGTWLPTLTSGQHVNEDEDFLLHAARHEAVRKSLIEHHTFPLRSHWFGGGYPTLGDAEDPALNPLVLLSVLFGSVMGLKLIAFVVVLVSGLSTYALARHILEYTRWGALFSALAVGMSLYVIDRMVSGSLTDLCPAYLPLCLLLVGLACRGRRNALFLLPFVLYTMLSDGKQAFFAAMLCVAVLCLLDALPMFSMVAAQRPGRKYDGRALQVLAIALGVTFLVGMVRILPVLEFMGDRGGLTHLELPFHGDLEREPAPWEDIITSAFGAVPGVPGLQEIRMGSLTVGWVPIILFGVAAVCFWRKALPWVIVVALFTWLLLDDQAPFNLHRLLARLPVFSTIKVPYKYFAFHVVFGLAVGAGQSFWLLRKLPRRWPWLEHLCAVILIAAAAGFLYPKAMLLQRRTYTAEIPAWMHAQQEEFYSVRGVELPRRRIVPINAVTYLNVLRNIGTVDWYAAMPIGEHAIPRYFVNAANACVPNPKYRGEAFFAGDDTGAEATLSSMHPNSITVQVTVPKPAMLVVNQNYHPAWRSDRGEVFDRDGLIGVRLEDTGSYSVRLRYLPRSFVVGLAASALSVGGWVLVFWVTRKRRRGRPEGANLRV